MRLATSLRLRPPAGQSIATTASLTTQDDGVKYTAAKVMDQLGPLGTEPVDESLYSDDEEMESASEDGGSSVASPRRGKMEAASPNTRGDGGDANPQGKRRGWKWWPDISSK